MKTKLKGILTLLLAFFVQISFAQEKTVSGTVSDSKETLPGVSVTIKGTTSGTETDFDGNYSIKVKAGEVLVFSYLGYKTIERTVSNATTINITLSEDANILEEVVVTSYGRALNSRESTAALSKVTSSQLENVPINSIDQVLQGNAAGVSVISNNGRPGGGAFILIRGQSTLQGSAEPLFVMDGIPIDEDNFRSLNQNDIENIQVLKDAAATSIYGNRGAGGVILITTKKGKYGQKLEIKARTNFGVTARPNARFEMMNSQQILEWQNRNGVSGGGALGGSLSQQEINELAAETNTNWQDVLFRQGETTQHEISFSSGTEKTTSFTSLSYFKQDGITLNSDLTRFSLRTNNAGKSADDKFNYSTNVSLNYSQSNFIIESGGSIVNPFLAAYTSLPYYEAYNPDGSVNIIGTERNGALNPDGTLNITGATTTQSAPYTALNNATLNTNLSEEVRALIGLNADYAITDKITIGASFGLDYINIQNLDILTPDSFRGLAQPALGSANTGLQAESTERDAQFSTNAFIRYNTKLTDKLSLNTALYGEYLYRNIQSEGFSALGLNPALLSSGSGFTPAQTLEGGNAIYASTPFSTENELALGSVFATLDMDYDSKYGIQASIRRDETSRFPSNPVGYFWSVGARWNLDQEEFLSDNNTISTLKLRASYGTVGNQNVGSFYQGLQTVSADAAAYQGQLGYFVGAINDESLKWETKQALNIGLSFGLWNNRLSGEFDYYNEKTVDLFGTDNRSVSQTGFNTVTTNVGSIRNQGVDLQVSYNILNKTATNPWGIRLNFNGNYNKDEVLEVPGGFTGGTVRNAEGRELNTWFLERWAGVDPSNGQPLYLDVDGNITNVFSNADRVYLDKSTLPTYTGGFGGDISYKGFSLNFLFSFAADVWRQNGQLGVVEDATLAGISNMSTALLREWTTPGQVTDIPAYSYNAAGIRFQAGDRYLEDASFMRLRNVTLAYTVDPKILTKTNFFSGLRMYLQGTNLATFTKWRGFDPEINGNGQFFEYPNPAIVTLGFDINF
jgi:TonB-linked SusC/RagA family outer membrane protein